MIMNLHLVCQITLVFLQRCRSQFVDYGQMPHFHNQISNTQPIHYANNFEIFNPPVNVRRNSVSSESTSCDSEKTKECVCSCDECAQDDPEDCCTDFCQSCEASNSIDIEPNQDVIMQSSLNYPKPPELVVIPYAVPVLIFPVKTWNKTNKTMAENSSEESSNNSTAASTVSIPIDTKSDDTSAKVTPEVQNQEEEGKIYEMEEDGQHTEEVISKEVNKTSEVQSLESAEAEEVVESRKLAMNLDNRLKKSKKKHKISTKEIK